MCAVFSHSAVDARPELSRLVYDDNKIHKNNNECTFFAAFFAVGRGRNTRKLRDPVGKESAFVKVKRAVFGGCSPTVGVFQLVGCLTSKMCQISFISFTIY